MILRPVTVPALALAAATLAFAGCGPRDDNRAAAGSTDDTVVVQAQPRAGDDRLGDPQRADRSAREAVRGTASDIAQAGRNAGEAAANKVSDAVITASVNAELARDPKLRALAIDVDTAAGRVALHGSAPDQASRSRAAQLAAGVNGVVSVDNQLKISSK
jgi:hypothetical protein